MQPTLPAGFNGFHPFTANFTQVPNEIWDMKAPGLSYELRWTLATLARVSIGEAYRHGGSPYDFFAIPWSQWMELLDLKTVNAVKNRLARMEAMGIIEIQQGSRGSWGTTPNPHQFVSPSVQETDRQTDPEGVSHKRWASWLKPAVPEPWPEAYSLLKKGDGRGSFSWSWKDKAFSPGEGYAVEETRWNHDERNGSLLAYLRDQLDLEARVNSPNRLSVKVVYYAVNSAGPQLILEGTVTAKGRATAYFVESAILDPGDSVRGLVDELMEDFTAFMK